MSLFHFTFRKRLPNPYRKFGSIMHVFLSGEAGRTLLWRSPKERRAILRYLYSHRSWVIDSLGEPLRELKILHDDNDKHWDREVNAAARKLRDTLELRMLVTIQVADIRSKRIKPRSSR